MLFSDICSVVQFLTVAKQFICIVRKHGCCLETQGLAYIAAQKVPRNAMDTKYGHNEV